MTNNDELALSRKEFEAIYNETHSVQITPAFKRFGYYTSPTMQKAWELWQQARKPLLAERDVDKKRIAELEDRTVSVKLPVVPSQYETLKLFLEPSDGYGMQKGAEYMRDEFIKALAAAGINLEVGE